jgi:hypothetical protein
MKRSARHMVVPGGGLSPDGSKWIACRPRYFLTVEVLSALFRRLFLQMLVAAHHAGRLQFFGDHVRLADKAAFKAYLRPLRQIDWVVYAKEPFAGPKQVLRYLSRYTHRIAISNRRLLSADQKGVTFKYKDYRIEAPARYKTRIGPYRRRKSRRATCRPLVHPDALILDLQQTDRGSRFCPTSSSPAPRLNPHSARRTAAELPTAISCLGAFPTPAARACGLIRDCRRPKTCTGADILWVRGRL